MRYLIIVIVLFFSIPEAGAQGKRTGKVKRKYQKAEVVNEELPEVWVHGRVRNADREPLPGATVVVRGTRMEVNTNENGEYFLTGLPTGKTSVMVSFTGYRTKIIDYYLKEGNNDIYFTLDRDNVSLEPSPVFIQQRDQHLLDIPASATAISGKWLDAAKIKDYGQMAGFLPGMEASIHTLQHPSISIRGISSGQSQPMSQPRLAVYYNQAPMSRGSMAVSELYDMDRIELVKGPQGSLFGFGAQTGTLALYTNKPQNQWGGYLQAGLGMLSQKEVQGAINLPLIDETLQLRLAGIYSTRDGYVGNTFGGNLNGKNTAGGRFSLRFTPFYHTRIDLMVNYQKDDMPGTAYMSRQFPNVNGVSDIFNYQASLDNGNDLYTKRETFGNILNIRHYRNENNYYSSITSYYSHQSGARWDGDGTQAPAMDWEESFNATQFTQELRYNFSKHSRKNGHIGVGYRRENAINSRALSTNEQHLAFLFLNMPEYFITPEGHSYPMPTMPVDPMLGELSGVALPDQHKEKNTSGTLSQSLDIFGDATWKLSPRISFTAGARGIVERFRVSNESLTIGDTTSVLGKLTGSSPNLFYKPSGFSETQKTWLGYAARAALKYHINSYSAFFAGYSRGRRPKILQFNRTGTTETLPEEVLHSFDAGFKMSVKQRIWLDATGFYQMYRDFRTATWDTTTVATTMSNAGKATIYGVESGMKAHLLDGFEAFGNYTWLRARFDHTDNNGIPQAFAGRQLRLAPEHSITVGFTALTKVHSNLTLFAIPHYTWKSLIWFDDANSPGLHQDAHGLAGATAGIETVNPRMTISVTGSNLTGEKYLLDAGYNGDFPGNPLFVPGLPRLLNAKITWRF